jgi:uncharacterized heparinase superfamily protein
MPRRASPYHRLKHQAQKIAFGLPFYHLTLGGVPPKGLHFVPPDPWPGNASAGIALVHGTFSFGGVGAESAVISARIDSDLPPRIGARWVSALHSYEWLRDLRAAGGDAARRQARLMVGSWLDTHSTWHPVSWSAPILGARIANWISQHDFYCLSADDAFRARIFDSLARQTRHLARILPGALQGADLITAIKGLAYGGLTLPGCEAYLNQALRLLEHELGRQIMPDGGHIARNPSSHMIVLRHLIDLRTALRMARFEAPESLVHAIDRMTPMLRFYRHGDNGLSLFNGGHEEEAVLIDTVFGQAEARGRPLKSAPHTGFERLLAGRTLVLMDTGGPPPTGYDGEAHAGTLSFELSIGRERMIVNCGTNMAGDPRWQRALAGTTAHSTLTIDETNSSEIKPDGSFGRRPGKVICERMEAEGAALVEASHDGYKANFGIIHQRRLFLGDSGEDLRGEDILTATPDAAAGYPFTIRFHLHPAVTVSMTPEGNAALLHLPSGIVWRLLTNAGTLTIEDSIYMGHGDEAYPTHQIIIASTSELPRTIVKWALRREKK